MKLIKKLLVTALIAVFIISLADIPAISNPVTAQAATVKLSKKTLTLGVGKSAKLQIKGAKKTVTWSSSDATIATVKKGKVTAVAIGEATITATVNKKKYTCAVKVTNPLLADAPFKAKDANIENMVYLVIPADWDLGTPQMAANNSILTIAAPKDTSVKSAIAINITLMPNELSYSDLKAIVTKNFTKDFYTAQYATDLKDTKYEITDLTVTDLSTNIGTVCKHQFTLNLNGKALTQQYYYFTYGNYFIAIGSGNENGTDLSAYIEYAINSLIFKN